MVDTIERFEQLPEVDELERLELIHSYELSLSKIKRNKFWCIIIISSWIALGATALAFRAIIFYNGAIKVRSL